MTLSELKYIVAVARERHFGRAARSCFVSQPTLSVAVKKLEKELDVILFERGASEIVLTPVGKQVVAQAQQVLESADRVKQIAKSGSNHLVEPLRIGVIFTIGPYLLPHLIPVLREQVPDMAIIIEEGFTSTLRTKLKQGSLDILIVSNPFEEPGIDTKVMYKEPFVAVVPASHPMAKRKTIKSTDLESESVLLLGKGNCFRDQVLAECPGCKTGGEYGDLQKSLESGSIETIRLMVASGVGVTVLPCTAVGTQEYSRNLLAVRKFADIAPTRDVILAWRKGFPRDKAVMAVAEAVLSCPIECVEMVR